jgi:hypothetical protein
MLGNRKRKYVGGHLPKGSELQLNKKEESEKGLKRLFVAHFFLWAYPKNASTLSSRFKGVCDDAKVDVRNLFKQE